MLSFVWILMCLLFHIGLLLNSAMTPVATETFSTSLSNIFPAARWFLLCWCWSSICALLASSTILKVSCSLSLHSYCKSVSSANFRLLNKMPCILPCYCHLLHPRSFKVRYAYRWGYWIPLSCAHWRFKLGPTLLTLYQLARLIVNFRKFIYYLLLNRAQSTSKTSWILWCNAVHHQTNKTNR